MQGDTSNDSGFVFNGLRPIPTADSLSSNDVSLEAGKSYTPGKRSLRTSHTKNHGTSVPMII